MQTPEDNARTMAQTEKLAELFSSPNPETHKVAAWAISVVGEPAIPVLLKAISTHGESMAKSAVEEIEWAMVTIGRPVIPYLKAMEGENESAGISTELAARVLVRLEKGVAGKSLDSSGSGGSSGSGKHAGGEGEDAEEHDELQGFLGC